MSNVAIVVPTPSSRGIQNGTGNVEAPKDSRIDRTAGKGRRRRAAAEQRRIEQQRWGEYLDNNEEDTVVAPSPINRRRMRRSSRRNSARDDLEDYLAGNLENDFHHTPPSNSNVSELDVALALSLSLSDSATSNESALSVLPDMSYESLVTLENVRCVASNELVDSLKVCPFSTRDCHTTEQPSEMCAICQGDYDDEDHLITLPCSHTFHDACGAEWLLKYSKLCPVCKHDITE